MNLKFLDWLLVLCLVLLAPALDAHADLECSRLLESIGHTNFLDQESKTVLGDYLVNSKASGLCGPTCALNVAQLVRSTKGAALLSQDELRNEASKLIEFVGAAQGSDARFGTDALPLAQGLHKLFKHTEIQAKISVVSDGRARLLSQSDLRSTDFDVWIFSVNDDPQGLGNTNHWMLGVYDPSTDELVSVNPQWPDWISRFQVKSGRTVNGELYALIEGAQFRPYAQRGNYFIRKGIGIRLWELKSVNLQSNLPLVFSKLEQDFLSSFQKTSGFSSFEAYQQVLNGLENTEARALLKLIRENEYDIVMARPEEARKTLLTKKHFSNFHETGTSMGDEGDPSRGEGVSDAKERRLNVEATYLGLRPGDYQNLPDQKKAKYAVIRKIKNNQPNSMNSLLADYGDDNWVFKKSSIQSRSTFTLGDSLARLLFNPLILGQEPRSFSTFQRRYWDEYFIPFKYIEAIVPETLNAFTKTGELSLKTTSETQFQEELSTNGVQALTPYRRSAYPHPLSQGENLFQNGDRYIEVQIFDDLTLDDVEAFEFRKSPPDSDLYEELTRRGIKIVDFRSGEATPYHP